MITAPAPVISSRDIRGRKTVRVAFIGAGAMAAKVHYPSLSSFDDVEICGICDLDPIRLNKLADQYHIENRFSNYRKMIEQTAPDAVYVIGPPHLMYDIWVWCLENKQNLFIEKPMGVTLHQSRCLAYLAEKNQCITQVSFQRRRAPMVVMLRDKCLERGPIVHGVCRFYKCLAKPHLMGPDHMMDDGVHAIDALRWICGGDVVSVHSVCKRIGTPDINFISATLEFDNGSTGYLINSWTSGRRVFDVEIHARGICVEAEPEDQAVVYADGDTKGVFYDTKTVSGSALEYVYGGFQATNREFIDSVIYNKLPSSHFGDAIKTMEVAETILAQARLKSI